MNDVQLSVFEQAIRATHDAEAELAYSTAVAETHEGEDIWRGEVLVFQLRGHPTASYCYAWEVDGLVTTVLHTGPIDSPARAVRASILAAAED